MIKWNPFNRKIKSPLFTAEFTDDENDHLMNCRECQKEIAKGTYDADKAGVKYWTDDELVDRIRKHIRESIGTDDGIDQS